MEHGRHHLLHDFAFRKRAVRRRHESNDSGHTLFERITTVRGAIFALVAPPTGFEPMFSSERLMSWNARRQGRQDYYYHHTP